MLLFADCFDFLTLYLRLLNRRRPALRCPAHGQPQSAGKHCAPGVGPCTRHAARAPKACGNGTAANRTAPELHAAVATKPAMGSVAAAATRPTGVTIPTVSALVVQGRWVRPRGGGPNGAAAPLGSHGGGSRRSAARRNATQCGAAIATAGARQEQQPKGAAPEWRPRVGAGD